MFLKLQNSKQIPAITRESTQSQPREHEDEKNQLAY